MQVQGTSEAYQRARKLRRELTKPERLLWWALKADNRLPLPQAACGRAVCARLLLRPSLAMRRGGWRLP